MWVDPGALTGSIAPPSSSARRRPRGANLTEEDDCAGHWIKATVQPDGRTRTITNGRMGYSRNYQSK